MRTTAIDDHQAEYWARQIRIGALIAAAVAFFGAVRIVADWPPDMRWAAGPVLAAAVPDEGAKHALVADEPAVFFTTHHFDGYAAVLVQLDAVTRDALGEAVLDGWLACAPPRLTEGYVER